MSTFFLQNLLSLHFYGLCALALILGASSRSRLRGIERGCFRAPAATALNNPLEGTPGHVVPQADPP